jgi:hypothetical protein
MDGWLAYKEVNREDSSYCNHRRDYSPDRLFAIHPVREHGLGGSDDKKVRM